MSNGRQGEGPQRVWSTACPNRSTFPMCHKQCRGNSLFTVKPCHSALAKNGLHERSTKNHWTPESCLEKRTVPFQESEEYCPPKFRKSQFFFGAAANRFLPWFFGLHGFA